MSTFREAGAARDREGKGISPKFASGAPRCELGRRLRASGLPPAAGTAERYARCMEF